MKIFDAQIRSDVCTGEDLKNLQYFDTERVVLSAHGAAHFERAEDLLSYFNKLTSDECARVEQCGLAPHVALGVLPEARPRRAHFEVWRELPFLLEQQEVVAVGEIGAWQDTDAHWELFERQVDIARQAGPLPVIATPPSDLRVNMTYKMMQHAADIGLPAELVFINRVDGRTLETVLREGFVAGVSVGSSNLEPREAARLLVDTVEELGSTERIVLASSLRMGGADILGIPKTVVALQDLGMDRRHIERLVYGNARSLFG